MGNILNKFWKCTAYWYNDLYLIKSWRASCMNGQWLYPYDTFIFIIMYKHCEVHNYDRCIKMLHHKMHTFPSLNSEDSGHAWYIEERWQWKKCGVMCRENNKVFQWIMVLQLFVTSCKCKIYKTELNSNFSRL